MDKNHQELYLKYRPKKLEDVVGQPEAVKTISNHFKKGTLPHAIILSGPTGTGKTTIAYILRDLLGCHPTMDFRQIDCAATEKPIDTIRELKNSSGLTAIGKCRMVFLEESQSFSRSNFGQQAMLLMLENPKNTYYVLATMDVTKLNKAIRGRCETIALKPISDVEMVKRVNWVAEQEQKPASKSVVKKIVEFSEGSLRESLVWLHKIIDLETEEEQLATIIRSDVKEDAIQIARSLMSYNGVLPRWSEVAEILKRLKDQGEEPEGLRLMILSYATSVCLGGNKAAGQAGRLLSALEFEIKQEGVVAWSRLVRACYECCKG